MEIEARVREFIAGRMKSKPAAGLSPDFRLIDRGVLDSMGMFEVIAFIEDTFGVVVDDDDLVAENFETTQAIADLVVRKNSSG